MKGRPAEFDIQASSRTDTKEGKNLTHMKRDIVFKLN